MDMVSFKGIVFIVSALVAVASSLLMVTRKNPIHSALWMIVTFFAMAVIYLLLNAQFIAVAQVMVYAGAIMMLILFVIMMVHMEKGGESDAGKPRRSAKTRIAWALITVVLLGEILLGALFYQMTGQGGEYSVEVVNRVGHVKTVGALLYGQYLFPFEIASILLLVGIVGAVVITKRK
ncbi:MAG: NADH-quinone oxidoreductase subunit J [Syntrophus sp. (in: bacteria)]|nr:NADH-quinone oxidoreductase subunit J [Syntrophus sp. (in: bacteria)]